MTTPHIPIIKPYPNVYDSHIQLFWEEEENQSITSYIISQDSNTIVLPPNIFNYTFSNLTNGTPYSFSIQASNENGLSLANTFYTVQPGFPPSSPSISSVIIKDNYICEIGWINSSNLGCNDTLLRTHISAYPVDSNNSILPSSNMWIHNSKPNGLPNEFNTHSVQLNSNYNYIFGLKSINMCGASEEIFSSTIFK